MPNPQKDHVPLWSRVTDWVEAKRNPLRWWLVLGSIATSALCVALFIAAIWLDPLDVAGRLAGTAGVLIVPAFVALIVAACMDDQAPRR